MDKPKLKVNSIINNVLVSLFGGQPMFSSILFLVMTELTRTITLSYCPFFYLPSELFGPNCWTDYINIVYYPMTKREKELFFFLLFACLLWLEDLFCVNFLCGKIL